jgi:hypothetical protein
MRVVMMVVTGMIVRLHDGHNVQEANSNEERQQLCRSEKQNAPNRRRLAVLFGRRLIGENLG